MRASRVCSEAERSTSNAREYVAMLPPLGRQTYSGKLPPCCRLKEIAIGRAHMTARRDAGPSAQNHLAGHELADVFAKRTRERLVSWIAGVGTGRPFPTVTEELFNSDTVRSRWMQRARVEKISAHQCLARDRFPFRFRWEPTTSPACKCISLEETYVAYGRVE